jgi:polyferredoxin/formate hydrogenlyase subunit 6/NADH:ubiquinone oxidoreductase subunit I
MNWIYGRRIRQATQILAFALFIYLSFAALQRWDIFHQSDLFFRLDPLAALAAMLASRAWIPRLGWALIMLGVTLLVGRVWCGWICPLGTLLEWVSFRRARRRGARLSAQWRNIKYFLLAVILAMALFGNLSLLIFDPLALFTRTMATAFIPALNYGVNAVEAALYPIGFLQPAVNWVEGGLRGRILPVQQPAFGQNVLIAVLLVVILSLNSLAHRFWCRYLCPLGALLGLLAKVSFLRPVIGSTCNHCAQCVGVCRPGAIATQQKTHTIMPSECTVCLDCLAACSQMDIHFRPELCPAPAREYDLSRRQALGALGVGAMGILLLRSDLRVKQHHPLLIRPPGVEDEGDFLASCLRCSQCMSVCPTSALQPALMEAGVEGLWTPILRPRAGYCDYGCEACGQVCPSGAIPSLTLDEKRQAVVGKAVVNRDRCLPWASATTCIVCEEMCPTPQKSIRLEEAAVMTDSGETIVVQRPIVLRDLCIGCGICENHCPLEGEAGIRVYGRL